MDVVHGEIVEAELNRLIEKRSTRAPDPDEREELWKQSVAAYYECQEAQRRAAWCEHHQGQAARLRAVLEALKARHEERARALCG